MLFMVIETFRNQNGKAVYRKLRDAGRGLPDGLKFVASYVSADLGRCFQLMETDDITLFQRWIADWQEVVNRIAWGEIWTRPHFDERTRRILVIGTMMAIGRWEEFVMHVRAAITEGGSTLWRTVPTG